MLYNIFLVMLSLGVLLFIASLVLVFVLKIPDLIDELSGNRAKRQIKRLKELNSGVNSLDSMSTNEVYKSLSSDSIRVEDIDTEEDEDIIKEVSREIDTGNLVENVGNSVDNSEVEEDEEKTGYMSSPDEIEPKTGYLGETEVPTGYISLEEQATGYIQEFEEATGFMQTAVDEEEATGVLSDVRAFVSKRQFVEIIEEQTSLNLSAVL